jgi:hypothetical protein
VRASPLIEPEENAVDEFVEVNEPAGCLENIKNAFAKVGTGFVMILVAFPLLFWNEGRAVKRAKDLSVGKGAVVSVDADKADKSLEGKLVHVTGAVNIDEPATDNEFGVQAPAVVMDRVVEMYQWKEDKETKTKKVNGKKKEVTTYRYTKDWESKEIKSVNFKRAAKHQNPSMPLKGKTYLANKASLGSFQLSDDLKKKWSPDETFALDEEALAGFKPINGREPVLNGNEVLFGNPSTPEVGDVRVRYEVALPGESTVVAGVTGTSLVKFSSDELNSTLALVQPGTKSAEAMFEQAEADNAMMTWILRGVGFFLMFAGFGLLFGPISAMARVVPILGGIVEAGTMLVAGILSVGLSFITISVGWVFYRPLIGIPLLLLGFGVLGGGAYFAFKKLRDKKANEPQQPAPDGAV